MINSIQDMDASTYRAVSMLTDELLDCARKGDWARVMACADCISEVATTAMTVVHYGKRLRDAAANNTRSES